MQNAELFEFGGAVVGWHPLFLNSEFGIRNWDELGGMSLFECVMRNWSDLGGMSLVLDVFCMYKIVGVS